MGTYSVSKTLCPLGYRKMDKFKNKDILSVAIIRNLSHSTNFYGIPVVHSLDRKSAITACEKVLEKNCGWLGNYLSLS
jgi:hypothetical protein